MSISFCPPPHGEEIGAYIVLQALESGESGGHPHPTLQSQQGVAWGRESVIEGTDIFAERHKM